MLVSRSVITSRLKVAGLFVRDWLMILAVMAIFGVGLLAFAMWVGVTELVKWATNR